jgi:2-polyprenyl-3-methyl-5-hydroxy-6-metoxy-1,4-benzoquinol methylase
MFKELQEINSRPKPYEFYTADELWTNEHTSKQMLSFHLNEELDLASRNKNFMDKSVDWIADYFNVDGNTKIADFGCGPGLYTTRLAEKGAQVTGIDFSENSIKYARKIAEKKKLQIDYIFKNYLEFETKEKYDLIIMIFCDLCALSPEQRKIMLKKYYSLLKDEGSLMLDVHSITIFDKTEDQALYETNQLNGFWSPNDYYAFVNTFKYEEEKVSLDKYTIFEENKKRIVYNWLQYYSKDSLVKELNKNGFQVEEFFSDVAGTEFTTDSDNIAVVAKKL